MYTKREAAQQLGIDRNTLDKWLEVCGIIPKRDPRDKRLCLLSEDDLLTLREYYAESHRAFNGASVHLDTASADLAARVAALEATIEQLREHSSWLFHARSASKLSKIDNINLATADSSHSYDAPRRQIVTTVSYKPNPALPPVPAHLMTIPQWCTQHGKSPKTVWHWKRMNKLPVVRGQWMEGMTRIDMALDAEGRKVAHQLAGIPWPCEQCVLVEDNDTPHPLEP